MNEELVSQLDACLRVAIVEVSKHTRIGTRRLIEDLESIKPVDAVRRRLDDSRARIFNLDVNDPRTLSAFTQAAIRCGRPELSIEGIARGPQFRKLFTEPELEVCERRWPIIQEHAREPVADRDKSSETITDHVMNPSFNSEIWLDPRGGDGICRFVEAEADRVEARVIMIPTAVIRDHISNCPECGASTIRLREAYASFDRKMLNALSELLDQFVGLLGQDEDELGRLAPLGRGDYENEEAFAEDRADFISEVASPRAAWRILRLGRLIGSIMKSIEVTHSERQGIWESWLKDRSDREIPQLFRNAGKDKVRLALAARNLLHARRWPTQQLPLILPANGDLNMIPGLLKIDETDDIEEWDEVMGDPPSDIEPYSLLSLCLLAVDGKLGYMDPSSLPWPNHGVSTLLDRLREISANAARVPELEAKFAAIANATEEMVARLGPRSAAAAEQRLRDSFEECWARLRPDTRQHLITAEQSRSIEDLRRPTLFIFQICLAFEVELRETIMRPLVDSLIDRGVEHLDITAQRGRRMRLSLNGHQKLSLTISLLILRHQFPVIGECLAGLGYERAAIVGVLNDLKNHRNDTAHGAVDMSFGAANELANKWLSHGGPGGVFRVLLRNH